jgi:hypothetical protein
MLARFPSISIEAANANGPSRMAGAGGFGLPPAGPRSFRGEANNVVHALETLPVCMYRVVRTETCRKPPKGPEGTFTVQLAAEGFPLTEKVVQIRKQDINLRMPGAMGEPILHEFESD